MLLPLDFFCCGSTFPPRLMAPAFCNSAAVPSGFPFCSARCQQCQHLSRASAPRAKDQRVTASEWTEMHPPSSKERPCISLLMTVCTSVQDMRTGSRPAFGASAAALESWLPRCCLATRRVRPEQARKLILRNQGPAFAPSERLHSPYYHTRYVRRHSRYTEDAFCFTSFALGGVGLGRRASLDGFHDRGACTSCHDLHHGNDRRDRGWRQHRCCASPL